jgi:hypothetical protein
MGYDLHIHRVDHWTDSGDRPITSAEWLAVVAGDPELHLDPANGPYFAVWDGAWFDWDDGRVSTKNPDRPKLAKMLSLAARLGARVQGDDGEFYERPEDISDERDENRPDRPWWRFW